MGVPPNMQLTGVDTEVWVFDADEPARLKSIQIGAAAYSFDDVKGAGQAGVTWVGRNDDPCVTTMVVNLWAEPGSTASERHELLGAWLATLGRGTALTSGGDLAELRCLDSDRFQMVRKVNVFDPQYAQFANVGWAQYEVQLRSDESWWRTDPVHATFTAAQFATATIDNSADFPAWPVVKITGPMSSITLGWEGETVTALPNVTSGHYLLIETDPNWWSVVDDLGADKSWIGSRWYKQIPPGDDIALTITGSGTSGATQVEMWLPQMYEYPL